MFMEEVIEMKQTFQFHMQAVALVMVETIEEDVSIDLTIIGFYANEEDARIGAESHTRKMKSYHEQVEADHNKQFPFLRGIKYSFTAPKYEIVSMNGYAWDDMDDMQLDIIASATKQYRAKVTA